MKRLGFAVLSFTGAVVLALTTGPDTILQAQEPHCRPVYCAVGDPPIFGVCCLELEGGMSCSPCGAFDPEQPGG